MGKLGKALILSPFATHPLDAGQRKRAYQTTSLLQEWGFEITFLHFAFETRWYWGHNSDDDAVLKNQWDGDVLHFYANNKVGVPPQNGESHQLDEWWDEALGGYIRNIFSKRRFDLFVVHNIWLSKAFDFAPYHCLKALEMHDLFSQRAKEFVATGVSPEFFHCSEDDEVFGLKRADLLLAIKEEDADWCKARDLGSTQVITIPYVETNITSRHHVPPIDSAKTRHPGKVIFGVIGSDIHFNRHAVHIIVKELDIVIRKTYAPIELVLAGSLCRSVGQCPVFVKKLGFVEHVEDFYSVVDIVMVPMLNGTGVKIKSVEALGHGKPVIFTSHSAEGTGFRGRTCSSLAEMAVWAAQIALAGIIPVDLLDACRMSITNTQDSLSLAKREFIKVYKLKRPTFLHILGTDRSSASDNILSLFGGLSLYKELAEVFRSCGFAPQPIFNQYIQSVPSQPLDQLHSMQGLLDAWNQSTFAIISYSQRKLLDLLPSESPFLIILDCRFDAHNSIQLDDDLITTRKSHLVLLVTYVQALFLRKDSDVASVVFPILTERSNWDPHLKPLLGEIIKYVHPRTHHDIHGLILETFDFSSDLLSALQLTNTSCMSRMSLEEAVSDLTRLIRKAAKDSLEE